jgi:AcrR family transcriptional regulator
VNTSETIRESFKELLRTTPYKRITVRDICDKAGVSRKTFYSHFLDKQDVVEKQFRADILTPITELQGLLPLVDIKSSTRLVLEKMYQNIYDDRVYYKNLLAMLGSDEFIKITTDEINKMNAAMLTEHDIPVLEREYFAYFSAASQAMLLLKWLKDDFRASPGQMARFFEKWVICNWESIVRKDRTFD